MENLVSIIMPVFNAKDYLCISLDSVFNQTFQNFEVIAVDDGSTDNSSDILGSYGNRITCIHQANKGPSAARNTGIRNAKGQYIAFLDADDIWLPHKLEKQVSFLDQNHQVDFLYSDYIIIDSLGKIISRVQFDVIADQKKLIRNMLIYNVMHGSNSSSIMKKSCFNRAGYFDETMKGCEDRDMWFRIAKTCNVQVLQEPLMQYRFHSNNAHKNLYMMLQGQKRYFKKNVGDADWLTRRKSMSYIYLDMAREFYAISKHSLAALNGLKSFLYYPLKSHSADDKYQILVKSIFPKLYKKSINYLKK